MNAKKSKKILLLAATSVLAASTVAVVALSSASELARTRGLGEVVLGSVSWSSSSQKTVHQANRVSYKTRTQSGTEVILYSIGQYEVSSGYIFSSKRSDYLKQGLFASSSEGTSESLFQFQGITSVTVVAASSSEEDAGFGIYTTSNSEGTPAYTRTVKGGEEEEFVISTEVYGAHYFALRATNEKIINIKSVSISYSCEPGAQPVDEYSISYYGLSGYDPVELEGIDTSSLVYSATAGSEVVISPVALDGYAYLGGFGYSENVEDIYDEDGVLTFIMPEGDATFVLVTTELAPALSSISLDISNVETAFTVGDSFSYEGLVVTANYSNGSSQTVTNFSVGGYNMSEAGEQTVTVSYSEGDITKTASYDITVTSQSQEVILEGTYNYVSRKDHSTPDWSLYNMTITFYNDGTAMWRNIRTNTLGNSFDCMVGFSYVATDNGANITIAMALNGYSFTKDGSPNNEAKSFSGGSYDRPIDGGFTSATAKNNSGVMTSNRSTLTINVYDQSHSYEVYDTFTFSLAE